MNARELVSFVFNNIEGGVGFFHPLLKPSLLAIGVVVAVIYSIIKFNYKKKGIFLYLNDL
jgi:hypothetical protein